MRGAVAPWRCAAWLVALLVLVPLLSLAATALRGSDGLWSHLLAHVLPVSARNTLLLLAGVGPLVVAIGAGCAWLVSAYDFPGRRVLAWALLLPLAVPTYIVAYAYLDLLHPLGPVQSALRAMLGIHSPRDFRLPDLRSLPGCIALLSLVLYPYVYLTVRAMFLTQAASLVEAARGLGVGGAALFRRVALPLARPALAVGTALALLEVLNDIGASEFLGVQTLTVAVYSTWVTRGDLPGAAQIACAMLLVVATLLLLEHRGRRRQRYAAAQRPRPIQPQRLRGARGWLATAACALPVLLGFAAPAGFLAHQAAQRLGTHGLSGALLAATANTLHVALLATALALVAGLLLAWAARLQQGWRRGVAARAPLAIGALGYALPGTVLAIALLGPLGVLDAGLGHAAASLGVSPPALLVGSLSALALACTLRFLAIAAGGLEAGFARIAPALDDAARSLGASPARALCRVHLPQLHPALLAAALLVFVDTMKELPATLLLRPLNFETLATALYAEAARGTYEDGALAALLIVVVGLLPVALLARAQPGSAPVAAATAAQADAAP